LELSDLAPNEVPETSCFLFEIIFAKLTNTSLEIQCYWILAVNAALNALHQEAMRGPRLKCISKILNQKIPSRKKLRVVALEH
jgi:hypothetical protein